MEIVSRPSHSAAATVLAGLSSMQTTKVKLKTFVEQI
jgi:hypothetical protein